MVFTIRIVPIVKCFQVTAHGECRLFSYHDFRMISRYHNIIHLGKAGGKERMVCVI